MHITRVVGTFSPEHGGPRHSISNYCLGQVKQGHRVSLRVVEGYPHTSPAVRLEPPVDMFVGRVGFPSRLGVSGELRRQLARDESPDIYHLHGAWLRAVHYAAVEARKRKRPYLLELMGMYDPYGLQQRRPVKWFARKWFQDEILRRAACLHVNSAQEGCNLRALGFRGPLAVIPVGVDTVALAQKQAALLASGPWPELGGRPFLLYLSRLHPKKGIELLLQSWTELARDFPAWQLVVAGAGEPDYVRLCRRAVGDAGLRERCLFTGAVTDVQKTWLYSHARYYVLPTYGENFGNTVAESLACGTPVVTTIYTPWSDLKRHQCGWLTKTDVESLTAVLREVIKTDESERRAMGKRGRELVEQKYSLDAVLDAFEEVSLWAMGAASQPACILREGQAFNT